MVAGKNRVPNPAAGITALKCFSAMWPAYRVTTAEHRAVACVAPFARDNWRSMLGCMSGDIKRKKQSLRAQVRQQRIDRDAGERTAASSAIAERLHELVERVGAESISCYLSTPAEPGTREFVNGAIDQGLRVLLPVAREDGLLDWVVADRSGAEVSGRYGPEPSGELLGPIAVNDVDLMIIPAAAVDNTGMRLGWGGGYFDKTLGSMDQRPPVYAVVYDDEFTDDPVPSDALDQPISGVVTPTRTVVLSRED